MHSKPGKGKIGGLAVYVGDCYIWAAIAYLDSPTDYRECLSHGKEQPAWRSASVMSLREIARRGLHFVILQLLQH